MTNPMRPWADGPRERPNLERRDSSRVRLNLEIAVPVLLRSDEGLTRGLARNISERGMLIEVEAFPPIGSPVDITIAGVRGSADAPEAITLKGEVRHHLAWQYAGDRRSIRVMRGVGIRFSDEDRALDPPRDPSNSLSSLTGTTIH